MAIPDKMQARYFRGYGFEAPTIIDVGVLNGTPFLYDAFPDREFILVDPLEESRAAVADLWGGLNYSFHVVALGARKGRIEMEIDPRRLARTSGSRRLDGDAVLTRREVDVVRLDSLTEGLPGPFGLKIDTEGQELAVLAGATRTLKRCEFVIAETSIKKRFDGGYRFSEMIAFMAAQGFEVHSFLSGLTRAPRMSDVLFVPADSPRFDMAPKEV
ncbi:FkbM family methyltransferase [Jannaschia sp. S6380]|uniref:FkbM family methyltransferase n=1 Tax=Jannaschia sp. S6380 TaxID=2926408 RepID=UPI001FF1F064|nr:FkbM family methyltransferase [Jannaschia sp. S6380]MCK0168610.1 FkbM family methyltransferase [Jannaschia sp. S6380]